MTRCLLIGSILLFFGACSDDASTTEGGSGDGSTAADTSGTGTPTDGTVGSSTNTPPTGTTADSDETTAADTDDTSGTTSVSSTGSSSGSGSGSDSGSSSGSGTSGTTSVCLPITEDTSAIGDDCLGNPLSCPEEYTCQDMPGIVAQAQCEIICVEDCDCPEAHSCEMMSAKGGSWMQCNPD